MSESKNKLNIKNMKPNPCLGVIRLDYDYPAAKGDIDCPDTFCYDVYYKVVPGLTFEMCQRGKLEGEVRTRFQESIDWLMTEKKVSCITGDCGFMMYYQGFAMKEIRRERSVAIVMSSLLQIPAMLCGLSVEEDIMVLTANEENLQKMEPHFKESGLNINQKRIHIVGCDNVPGFEAVAEGGKVDSKKVQPGIVALVKEKLNEFPKTKAILLECTELPHYANAIRCEIGLPVFDAITCCNFFINGFQEEDRFGKQGWQEDWDGVQEEYIFAQNVKLENKVYLVNKPTTAPVPAEFTTTNNC